MEIGEFLWPEDRIQHIGRHNVQPEEFEEVCFGSALVLRSKSHGKNPVYYVLGETAAGRRLFCVVISVSGWQGVSCDRTRDDRERENAVCSVEERMRIPITDSIQELAEFWDTHSVTDFEDELEEVSRPVFARKPADVVRVPLTPEERAAVQRMAASRGVDEAALIHEWVQEKLQRR